MSVSVSASATSAAATPTAVVVAAAAAHVAAAAEVAAPETTAAAGSKTAHALTALAGVLPAGGDVFARLDAEGLAEHVPHCFRLRVFEGHHSHRLRRVFGGLVDLLGDFFNLIELR